MHDGWCAILSVAMLLASARLIAQTTSPSRGWAIALHGGAGEGEWEHMDAATAAALWPFQGYFLARACPRGISSISRTRAGAVPGGVAVE